MITVRHDNVNVSLGKFVRKCWPNATVFVEPRRNEREQTQRPDLLIYHDNTAYVIDVMIRDPSSPSTLSTNQSHRITDATNKSGEAIKRRHYNQWANNHTIVPFVIEATGRLGPSAELFIKAITGVNTKARSLFLTTMHAIIARYNGSMFSNMASYIRPYFEYQ